jgi:hypothetical protein
MAQLADDPVTDLLEDLGNVGVVGWFGFDKVGFEALVAATEVNALKEVAMGCRLPAPLIWRCPRRIGGTTRSQR